MIESNFIDHDKEYTEEYLSNILKSVKTIAMIGASSDPTKFSYGVLRVLHETGYKMIPVNPKEAVRILINIALNCALDANTLIS